MNEGAAATDRLEGVKSALRSSLCALAAFDAPYSHWIASNVLPPEVADRLRRLPLASAPTNGVSGKRELHNQTRQYFDADNIARFDDCAAIAAAFQSPEIVSLVEGRLGANLAGAFVRLEYAQDVDGFWLEPHTDLGVKRFTMLIYLRDRDDQADLGTDLYAGRSRWAARTPFEHNSALIFIPGADTWHGLERRPIGGVRRSVIMNYVTADWQAREQLAYPSIPVGA